MSDLDASDREASSVHQPTSEALQTKIARLNARQQRYHGVGQEITASGETQLSLAEPASRARPKRPTVDVGDTGHIAVDSTHPLMVEHDVTTAVTDDDQRSPLAWSAKETLGVERMRAVAEMGYDHGPAITAGDEAGSAADGPNPSTSANTKLGLLGKERFRDDPQQDGELLVALG